MKMRATALLLSLMVCAPAHADRAPYTLQLLDDIKQEGMTLYFEATSDTSHHFSHGHHAPHSDPDKVKSGFHLFEILLSWLSEHDDETSFETVQGIGQEGTIHTVGAEMTRVIEKAFGRDMLVCISELEPTEFARAYMFGNETLPEGQRGPDFSAETRLTIRQISENPGSGLACAL